MTTSIDRKNGWLGIEQLLTAAEVGRILRCAPTTVSELRRAGDIASIRVGRTYHFAPDDVRAFIAAQRQMGAGAGA
ncbi:helix-turn-helix domain-containing protein [Isoptericola dokdonensis]|uniref:Helix-turn-helix domain protein n=1 Tax=Isoptericola dokdonensis DS-3 TaxID=1300344 RepID=A0A161I7C7_9MICO|nr:helix-turn-helix domain-containing protein [Isoptericola dokdonensis]ANC31468.1 Helix-turn-helix domain protein [Isoptericola dokdonensis DS-3]